MKITILGVLHRAHFGTDTVTNLGLKLWKLVLDEIKNASSLSVFKFRIKTWITDNCPCRICKTFVKALGFIEVLQISNGIHNSYLQYVTISSQKLDVRTMELS